MERKRPCLRQDTPSTVAERDGRVRGAVEIRARALANRVLERVSLRQTLGRPRPFSFQGARSRRCDDASDPLRTTDLSLCIRTVTVGVIPVETLLPLRRDGGRFTRLLADEDLD